MGNKKQAIKYIISAIITISLILATIIITKNIAISDNTRKNIVNEYGNRTINLVDKYLNFEIDIIDINYGTKELYNGCIKKLNNYKQKLNYTCKYIYDIYELTKNPFENNYNNILEKRNNFEKYLKEFN